MTGKTPPLKGDLRTASKQALAYGTAMSSLPSLSQTVAQDALQLTTHAQAWLVLLRQDGTMHPVPTKVAGYDCSLEEYSLHRRVMQGTRAALLIAKWASPAAPSDPAFQCVREFCAQHGVVPRENFRVLVSPDMKEVQPEASAPGNDQLVANLILAVLPRLDAVQRARVADQARRF